MQIVFLLLLYSAGAGGWRLSMKFSTPSKVNEIILKEGPFSLSLSPRMRRGTTLSVIDGQRLKQKGTPSHTLGDDRHYVATLAFRQLETA